MLTFCCQVETLGYVVADWVEVRRNPSAIPPSMPLNNWLLSPSDGPSLRPFPTTRLGEIVVLTDCESCVVAEIQSGRAHAAPVAGLIGSAVQ